MTTVLPRAIDAPTVGRTAPVVVPAPTPAIDRVSAETLAVLATVEGPYAEPTAGPTFIGPDWIGPVLVALLFGLLVVTVVVMSGGLSWNAW